MTSVDRQIKATRRRLMELAERKDQLPPKYRALAEKVLEESSTILEELCGTAEELTAAREEVRAGEDRRLEERERLLAQVDRQCRRADELAGALERERDTLQTIMENTHAHLAYLDADFNFVRVNEAYAQGSGYSKEELIGRHHFDLFPHPENEAIFEQVRDTGEPVSFQARPFVFPNRPELGTTYWDWTLVPDKDEQGEIQGFVFSLVDVTERERLMTQLEAERARLQAIIQNAPEGIVVTDEEGRIALANPAAERLYARSVPYGERFESHAQLQICHPDGTPYDPCDLPLTRSTLDGEEYTNVEMVIVWPDGQQRDLLVDTAPIRNRRGEIAGAVGVFRDMTQRKRMEEMVRRYADRLRVLHEIDKAVLAAQTAEEIANVALLHLHKLVPCHLASVELFDLEAGEASILSVRAEGETSLENGRRHQLVWYEPMEALREGRPYIVENIQAVSANPLVEALQDEGVRSFASVPLITQGELIGCLSFARDEVGGLARDELEVVRDLGDQLAIGIHQARLNRRVQDHAKELEQRVAARTAQLRASEARFRAIFEQTAVGVALLDDQGRVIASNPALHEMLGCSGDELTGRMFTDFAHPDEDIEADVEIYKEIMAGERDYYRVETRYVGKEDKTGWANMILSLVRGGAGEPQFAIAMVEDVTERKKAQAAMIQSEKLAMTGRLAASLAHEVNNPLQTVIGCLGLAEESLARDDGDDLEQYIMMAHEELRRAARIVSRLRDLSRPTDVDAGEPTDVNELVERVLKLSRKEFESRRIEPVRHLAENLPQPALVPDRMQQVFLNLVLNAVDVMPEGGQLRVSTSHDEASDEVLVTFADDGPGIPADVLPNLFDPFFSTKPEGVGLGLFVSRNIVQEHGGRIEVETELGDGAAFTVCLPV